MSHSLFNPTSRHLRANITSHWRFRTCAAGADRTVRRSFDYAAEHLARRRPSFPADPGPDAAARPRDARDGHAADRSSRPGIRQARQALPRRHQDDFQDRQSGHHLYRDRHRRLGSRPRQHAVARRQGADGRDRAIRHAMEDHGGQARPDAGIHPRRLAHRRRRGEDRRASAQGQGARDQGGLRAAQRNRDRLPVADRSDPQGDQCRGPSGAA